MITAAINALALVAMIGTLALTIRDRNHQATVGYSLAIIWFLLYMMVKYLETA